MIRPAILAFVFATAAVAAPVPPPTEMELLAKHWGKTEGQGEFELKGKQLTLRTVGQPAQGMSEYVGMNMPRVARKVSGDFEITVTVLDVARPNRTAAYEGTWPNSRAGLFAHAEGWGAEFSLCQCYMKPDEAGEEPKRCVWLETLFPPGGESGPLKDAENGKSTWLRMTRKGKTVTVSYSFDGEKWSAPFALRPVSDFTGEVTGEVTVGAFLGHSTYQTLEASFGAFTIEKPKAEPK